LAASNFNSSITAASAIQGRTDQRVSEKRSKTERDAYTVGEKGKAATAREENERPLVLTVGEEAKAERELAPEHLDLPALHLEAPDAGLDPRRRSALGHPSGAPRGEQPEVQPQIQAHPDLPDVQPHAREKRDERREAARNLSRRRIGDRKEGTGEKLRKRRRPEGEGAGGVGWGWVTESQRGSAPALAYIDR
jgi:hypothetical protein